MASPNLIFNRIHPMVSQAASAMAAPAFPASLFAPLHHWRHDRVLQRANSEDAARIRGALSDGFSPRTFAADRRADYERLFLALERGDLHTLKRSLSSACMASTRAGQEARAPLRARMLSWEASSGVAACGVYFSKRSDAKLDRPPDFVQVTMRNAYTCELRVEGSAAAAAAAAQPPRPRLGALPPPLWETVLHHGTGTLYWWDRFTGRVTWEQPSPGAFVAAHAAHPFRLETSGKWEELGSSSSSSGGSKVQRAKVVHDVVWERAVTGGVNQWYVVRW